MLNERLKRIEKEGSFSLSIKMAKEYREAHPDAEIVSLGIGDVSFPVSEVITEAMKKACSDLSSPGTFQGYGAYWGIESLRKTIAENDYGTLDISAEEIYVGDGTKTDSTSILELFDPSCRILVGDPSYPIYRNGAYALSRDVSEAECDENFKMLVPEEHYDIIYICSPCNPVGNAYTRDELRSWVDYANREHAVIIYDGVYRDFIRSEGVPRSIYEIEGSKSCAIELYSYSKSASFSGTRCSYMVLPKEFGKEVHALWRERTMNRFNGASYVAQKGAEASYLPEAKVQIRKNIECYRDNALLLKKTFLSAGFEVVGGTDSPYLFVTKPGTDCMTLFSFFLEELQIITVPGSAFGKRGKESLRISALGSRKDTEEACRRIRVYYEKSR